MIVFCDGMPRSGSTWAFNVVVKLLQSGGPNQRIYGAHTDLQDVVLGSLEPAWEHVVIKTHSLDTKSRVLSAAGGSKAIYTWRDPYDAVVSTMRMFGYSFEKSLASIRSSIDLWRFHKATATALIVSYRSITHDPARTIEAIGAELGLTLSKSVVDQTLSETSFETMKRASKHVEQLGSDRLVREGVHVYDRQTLLHQNHILDGGSGYGEKALSPGQRSAVDDLIEESGFWSLAGGEGQAQRCATTPPPPDAQLAPEADEASVSRSSRAPTADLGLPVWAREMAWISTGDEHIPSEIEGVNLVLNRRRLAEFLTRFAEDRDVWDLLALDVLGVAAGLPLSSTGAEETTPNLTIRPFRLWEYAWLYKTLQLSAGGLRVLDLGGPASHLSILAALAGCRVTSLDINPTFVKAGQDCAEALELPSLDAQLGDMRDLSGFPDESFDAVISCSVLEHLTGDDQKTSLKEVARVLKPGGLVGLTFDLGQGAPGANEHLPPPHEPPGNSKEALHRYQQGGLVAVGNPFSEDPIPGSLFHHDSITYTVASLFLAKPPVSNPLVPQPKRGRSRLDALGIRGAPYRIYRHASAAIASVNSLRSQMDHTIGQLRSEIDLRDAALNDMRGQLERAVATVHAQHERSIVLEKAAEERLVALLEKEAVIIRLHAELDAREAALRDARSKKKQGVGN